MKKLSFGLMLLFGSFFVGADMFACTPPVHFYTINTGNNKVYFDSTEIVGADASTRQQLRGDGDLAKDKNNVYYFGKILSGANPTIYKPISGPFWGDDDQVFFGHKVTTIERRGFDGENKTKKALSFPKNRREQIEISGIYKSLQGRILLYLVDDGNGASCGPYSQYIQLPKNLASTLFIRKAQKISSGSGTVSKKFTKQFLKYVQTNTQPQ